MESVVVEPAGYFAAKLGEGDLFRIVQVEGMQVADFLSFNLQEPGEKLSMFCSRAANRNWRLTQGHTLYSNQARPMWIIEEDTVRENYCGGGYCGARINQLRYGVANTLNCEDNLVAALSAYGFGRESFDPDVCFNVFMAVAYEADGAWEIREPKSGPGDRLFLRSLMAQLVAVSNCPQILNPCNAGKLKPLRIEIER